MGWVLIKMPLNQTIWEAVVCSVDLIVVLVWVMLSDWGFDAVGMWRGRNFVGIWCDELVDIRIYAYVAR